MIQFLKNIWYAQRNAAELETLHEYHGVACDRVGQLHRALMTIALSNRNNTNGTVRKHIRIARKALGLEVWG